MYPKPTIFISHIHENKELTLIIKELIDTIFENVLNIFVSSDSESIELGDEWMMKINDGLKQCDIMLLVCSPQSINRPWIAFEAGVGWSKGIKVIPLCCFGLTISNLPLPFNRWQAANANREDSLNRLMKIIAKEFELKYNEVRWKDTVKKYSIMIKGSEGSVL
ncbi:MAG TPA: toll/interleukin-1 receptor domain-containing protein [Sedimentibacter sp.]|nr:toll/interleukin-1 receptor domain-containing protein [Sedimentibacter sp.]